MLWVLILLALVAVISYGLSQLLQDNGPQPPSVLVSTTESTPSSTNPIPVTFTWSRPVVGFENGDIEVFGGSSTNFASVPGGLIFTADIVPDSTDEGILVSVPAEAATADSALAEPSVASNVLGHHHDAEPPTAEITSEASPMTTVNPIPVEVKFSEACTTFDASSDVVVTYGLGSPLAGLITNVDNPSTGIWTFDVTGPSLSPPDSPVTVSVHIPGGTCEDEAGNALVTPTALEVSMEASPA